MQGNAKWPVTVNLHGTLSANAQGEFKLPFAAVLQSVQLTNGAANSDATLVVGTSADADGIFTAAKGVMNATARTPTVLDNDDFDGDLFTGDSGVDHMHLAKDTIVVWALDFDGGSGTAAANVTIIFTFDEG